MIHHHHTVVRFGRERMSHIVEARLSGKTEEEVLRLLPFFSTLCELPCPLATVTTKEGDGTPVCAVCAKEAQKRGLL